MPLFLDVHEIAGGAATDDLAWARRFAGLAGVLRAAGEAAPAAFANRWAGAA